MAQAATAYAKMNNRLKIIPCMSSIGPGAANMVTAAATATVNNIPLLLFMGDDHAATLAFRIRNFLAAVHGIVAADGQKSLSTVGAVSR